MQFTRRLLLPVALVVLVLGAWLGPLDSLAEKQVDAGLTRALVSFASARALNAVISVVQGTEVAVEPLGVGVNLAPGQILDPINDLVETFSQLMLIASVSFGVQKMLLMIGGQQAVSVVFTVAAILCLVISLSGRPLPAWLSKAFLIMVVFRFAVPAVAYGSDMVYQHFLAADYKTHQDAIENASKNAEALSQQTVVAPPVPEPKAEQAGTPPAEEEVCGLDCLWEKTKKSLVQIGEKTKELGNSAINGVRESVNVRAGIDKLKAATEEWTKHIVMMIVNFLLQTLVVPLLLLWALLSFTKGLLRDSSFLTPRRIGNPI